MVPFFLLLFFLSHLYLHLHLPLVSLFFVLHILYLRLQCPFSLLSFVFCCNLPSCPPPISTHKSHHVHKPHCGSFMTVYDIIFISLLCLHPRCFYSPILLVRRWIKGDGAKERESEKEGRFGGWRWCRSKHVRHNGRTGVSEGSCFIFFEVPNESTPVFIPINPKGPDCHGSLGSLAIAQGSKNCGRERKGKEGRMAYQPLWWVSWEFFLSSFFLTYADESTP